MSNTRLEPRTFRVDDDASPFGMEAVCVQVGDDLVVVVGGGERYHIGAAALTISLPSIKDPQKTTHSSYLVPVPGHKEEDLARDGSLRLAKALNRNVVVTAGIHVEQITAEGIRQQIAMFHTLLDQIVAAYRSE